MSVNVSEQTCLDTQVCVILPFGVTFSKSWLLQPHHTDPGSRPQTAHIDKISNDYTGQTDQGRANHHRCF